MIEFLVPLSFESDIRLILRNGLDYSEVLVDNGRNKSLTKNQL